jgi:hypothetical protein
MSDVNEPLNCPLCSVSLLGEPIPKEHLEYYAGTHYKREIGYEDPEIYDGIYYWQCPDCKHEWGGYRALSKKIVGE